MNTTILLSTQRSGTTFFDRKICGMYGFPRQGGELLRRHSFETHNSDYLLKRHSITESLGNQDKIQGEIKTLHSDKDHFIEITKDLLPTIVSNSDWPMFNIQYNFIGTDAQFLEKVDTQIIHLIRKNCWLRSISEYIMKNQDFPPHITKPELQTERVVNIDKNKLIKYAKKSYKNVQYFREKLKEKSNVMVVYYEDIAREEYWTDDFIKKLESFMGQKFTNKEYQPPHMKVSNFVTITNEEEIMDEELIQKYYIN